jgi:AmmeMemoRadiSam system protein A
VVGYGAFALEERDGEKRAYSVAQRKMLVDFARESLRHCLEHGCPSRADPSRFPAELFEKGAAFVTLFVAGELRGCIGSIRAHRPLIHDVAENACAAAFEDARFPSLERAELEELEVRLSVLSDLEPVHFSSEAELLGKLRPGVDGLVLEDGGMRGTLLPSMWEELKTPAEFLVCLKRKAHLPPDHWSPTLKVWRFTTESFS